jgi:hypothetical protein
VARLVAVAVVAPTGDLVLVASKALVGEGATVAGGGWDAGGGCPPPGVGDGSWPGGNVGVIVGTVWAYPLGTEPTTNNINIAKVNVAAASRSCRFGLVAIWFVLG